MATIAEPVFHTDLQSLDLINRGKVRDIYAVDDDHMLIVASDRLSAFDVVLPDPIPGKGAVLTELSNFWFERTEKLIRNHLSSLRLEEVLADADECARVAAQAVVVRRLEPLPVEAIVRGYLIGSGWKDYQASGQVSVQLYEQAVVHAAACGIIIADTKFEFGLDAAGGVVLIDEVLTPDSSRFWPADEYAPGASPPSFDKQYVRDYLETTGWDKTPPAPSLPAHIIERTAQKYQEARDRLIA